MIKVKNISKVYIKGSSIKKLFGGVDHRSKGVEALHKVSFEVKEGEVVGLIGPNGAGKTTAAKIISGLLLPNEGSVMVGDQDPSDLTNKFKRSYALFRGEVHILDDGVIVKDAINERLQIYNKPVLSENDFVQMLIESLDASTLITQIPDELSQGERTIVELITAITHQPKYMILDEPTNGLDIVATQKFLKLLNHLKDGFNTTIIITSHNLHNVVSAADKIVLINKGEVVLSGSTEEILKKESGERKVRVELDPSSRFDRQDLDWLGVDLLVKGPVLEFQTTKNDLKSKLIQLLKDFDIKDIKVADPPLEDIFEKYYR